MNEPNSSRPVSPELKRLQQPEQNGIRTFLRTIGPLVLIAGVICTIGGGISFFSAFGGDEPPRYFWLCFIGLPLMFFGFTLSQLGYMGAAARYMAGEAAPVAADTVNYMADETKGAVETVAKSVARGIVEGIEDGKTASEKRFCPHCRLPVKTDFMFCPKCGKAISGT
jgi:hypothetical protein